MRRDGDRDEALSICNKGLPASLEYDRDAYAATGRRFIQRVIEPLEAAAAGWQAENAASGQTKKSPPLKLLRVATLLPTVLLATMVAGLMRV